jgi:hypothetical protein
MEVLYNMYQYNSLSHVGILGMKWGKRKAGVISASPPKPSSADHEKKLEIRKKKLNEMTNDELSAFTRRMALEKQYKELTKPELTRGQKIVKSILNSATKGATDMTLSYVNKQSAKMVEQLIKKATAKTIKTASKAVK